MQQDQKVEETSHQETQTKLQKLKEALREKKEHLKKHEKGEKRKQAKKEYKQLQKEKSLLEVQQQAIQYQQKEPAKKETIVDQNDTELISAIGGAATTKQTIYDAEARGVKRREAGVLSAVARLITLGVLKHDPILLETDISEDAKKLLIDAYAGLDPNEIVDYHTHLIGKGHCCDSGCFAPDPKSLKDRVFENVMKEISGAESFSSAEEDFVQTLRALVYRGKHFLLAFDYHYNEAGEIVKEKTGMYTPNDFVWSVCAQYPDLFIPSCSVHPYRKDALEELERCVKNGARLIKWLPNAMGIDPLSEKCDAYYKKVKELDMVILSHCGEEKAVKSDESMQDFGNPLRFSKCLNMGCKVFSKTTNQT